MVSRRKRAFSENTLVKKDPAMAKIVADARAAGYTVRETHALLRDYRIELAQKRVDAELSGKVSLKERKPPKTQPPKKSTRRVANTAHIPDYNPALLIEALRYTIVCMYRVKVEEHRTVAGSLLEDFKKVWTLAVKYLPDMTRTRIAEANDMCVSLLQANPAMYEYVCMYLNVSKLELDESMGESHHYRYNSKTDDIHAI